MLQSLGAGASANATSTVAMAAALVNGPFQANVTRLPTAAAVAAAGCSNATDAAIATASCDNDTATISVLQPAVTTAAAGRCSNDAAPAPDDDSRPPRGRMALLEKTLASENEVRVALLQEEHALRVRLLTEDHEDILRKRAEEHEMTMDIKRAKKELVLLKLKRLQQE